MSLHGIEEQTNEGKIVDTISKFLVLADIFFRLRRLRKWKSIADSKRGGDRMWIKHTKILENLLKVWLLWNINKTICTVIFNKDTEHIFEFI